MVNLENETCLKKYKSSMSSVYTLAMNLNYFLKLDLYDKKQPTNKLKIRILSETSIPYLIRHASFILIVSLHL